MTNKFLVCGHPSHKESEEKTKEEDETKYCVEDLWHKPCRTATGHNFKCSHPFSNAHVIFICDTSGSMSDMDKGKSKAEYSFISDYSGRSYDSTSSTYHWGLNNRLGALYSSIHKFIQIRMKKGCKDTISAVMTPGVRDRNSDKDSSAVKAAERVTADTNFVRNYLLSFTPNMNENYGAAFKLTDSLIDKSEETVVIFLCDGISADNGAAAVAKNLKSAMDKRFSLFCITLGPGCYNNNKTVKDICTSGQGRMISTLSGNELGM